MQGAGLQGAEITIIKIKGLSRGGELLSEI